MTSVCVKVRSGLSSLGLVGIDTDGSPGVNPICNSIAKVDVFKEWIRGTFDS